MLLWTHHRKFALLCIDIGIFIFSGAVTAVVSNYSSTAVKLDSVERLLSILVFGTCIFAARLALSLYSNIWRYASCRSYIWVMLSDVMGGLLGFIATYLIGSVYLGIWQSGFLILLFDSITLASRFFYQITYGRLNKKDDTLKKVNVAIVGAGMTGVMLADELKYGNSKYNPVFFIDTDKDKIGSRVCGIRVYGENEETLELIKTMQIHQILIALPTITGEKAKSVIEFYSATGCSIKLYDFPFRDSALNKNGKRVIRNFDIDDLLFRDTITVNNDKTNNFYNGKVVLVTGGGGSIGSEICRQIALCRPKQLIVFDIYENNAYDIQQELTYKYGSELDLAVEIGSVRDRDRLDAVFNKYRPQIVFHAAAHKHVPLMEHSSCEAIKNNVFGTRNTADFAEKYGAQKFVLISTDKAVNPTNIMGASKRMCEMIIQCRSDSKTSFAAVRFGNVLGSNGSAIPLFKRQIEKGGPVTITDKRIIRYFMTIPEASQLVINAGAMAKSGELFVLDMGKPIKIWDLAESMIRLSGLQPYTDIDIQEIGLRPGEKLYEELLIKNEDLDRTENDLIFIERDHPLTREEVNEKLMILDKAVKAAAHSANCEGIKEAMKLTVPTYKDPDEVNGVVSGTPS